MIKIPIILLKSIVDEALLKVRSDLLFHIQENTEEESWLYRVFGENQIDGYNFYTQCKSILLRGEKDPRKIQTKLLFSPVKSNSPVIYFNEPSESPGSEDYLGINLNEDPYIGTSNFVDKLGRSFKSSYEIVIVSMNNTETIMLYNLIKAILISLKSTLSHYFYTYQFSGQQLMDMSTLSPEYFYKSVVMLVDYSIEVPDINSTEFFDGELEFQGYDVNRYSIFDTTFDNTFE